MQWSELKMHLWRCVSEWSPQSYLDADDAPDACPMTPGAVISFKALGALWAFDGGPCRKLNYYLGSWLCGYTSANSLWNTLSPVLWPQLSPFTNISTCCQGKRPPFMTLWVSGFPNKVNRPTYPRHDPACSKRNTGFKLTAWYLKWLTNPRDL